MNKEFLQNFKIGDQALPDVVVNAILEENQRDMNAVTHPEDNGATGAKLFTQEEVNRIISDRLAKERAKAEPKEDEREQALKARENRMDCREYIAGKKYPVELLDILDTGNAETFKSIADKLAKAFPAMLKSQTPPPYAPGTGSGNVVFSTDPIAAAFKPPKEWKE